MSIKEDSKKNEGIKKLIKIVKKAFYLLLNKENAVSWFNKGLRLEKSGDYEEAIKCYNKARS